MRKRHASEARMERRSTEPHGSGHKTRRGRNAGNRTLRRAVAAAMHEMSRPFRDPDDHGPGCDGPYNCTCPDQ